MAAFYSASENYGLDLQTEAGWRGLLARYWGNVTLVDRSVAKILQALDESGKADDTIVIFTSDHGELMGDHGILGKTLMYEESIKVPVLLRVPMLDAEPRRIGGQFSHIDLVPTLLDLLGLEVPAHLQGQSRVPVLCGRDDLAANDVFVEWSGADGHPPASIGEAEPNPQLGASLPHHCRGRWLEAQPVWQGPRRAIRPERGPPRVGEFIPPTRAASAGRRTE